ncbi:Methylated-DNA--protein-cysteine methyltransferase [Trichinella pseudospiralis]
MRNNFVNTTTDMKTITHFEELDISNPADWEEYSERLVCFLQANSIREGTIRLAALCSSRLREQLVCGLPDGNLQNQLLTDRELTFAKVLERALLAEVAIAQASGIRSLNSTVTTEVQHTRKVTVTARCETTRKEHLKFHEHRNHNPL